MRYVGAVLDCGRDFATIETDSGTVVLKMRFEGSWSSGVSIEAAMDVQQANEMIRHLRAAIKAIEIE